jgi:predicted Rossmann-fold nucleotide-binding protein
MEQAMEKEYSDCIFLGCELPKNLIAKLDDCLIFPTIDVPFNTFLNKLYSRHSLLGEYRTGNPDSYNDTHDMAVYHHYLSQGKEAGDIKETLARRLHDHSVTDALHDFLQDYDEKSIVAIMGGHNMDRDSPDYRKVAGISKALSERGYLMISGGGPGAMEATHVGAWFAGMSDLAMDDAIEMLKKAPRYTDRFWMDTAFRVLEKYPVSLYKSVGIPTWLYGHEPPTPFATHIAKYFANSVREDGLLALAKGGVIFAPGNAGTIQEIFQDATQNHYLSYGYASPMVFFNSRYWHEERPVYPLIKQLSVEGKYQNMILSCCDTEAEVIAAIAKFTAQNPVI